ncbi:hypothetical protein PCANC_01751 [Puccinia coronata f. sp. avenae]|uniref:Uncharacterized protein n=1 Tax=Puccinia coronata f. sp. avenae TaxID=200324 RepID=A0A2N5W549_9BASI|nr:hypothetical protein PCANC_01751 [Puccinia coronata f. sp. avenae]
MVRREPLRASASDKRWKSVHTEVVQFVPGQQLSLPIQQETRSFDATPRSDASRQSPRASEASWVGEASLVTSFANAQRDSRTSALHSDAQTTRRMLNKLTRHCVIKRFTSAASMPQGVKPSHSRHFSL